MKPISEAANAIEQGRISLPKDVQTPSLDLTLVSQLFIRMNSIYGHLWSSRFKTDRMLQAAKMEWGMSLAKYSRDDLEFAIAQCKRVYQTPPSLPQFLMLMPSKEPSHKEFKRLPVLRSEKEHGRSYLEKMKQKLGVKP